MDLADKALITELGQEIRLRLTHEQAGFFSLCSVTLAALESCANQRKPVAVEWPAQSAWRDPEQLGRNLFTEYFNPKSGAVPTLRSGVPLTAHGVYADLKFESINPFIRDWFAPSAIVLQRKREFLEKYSLDPAATVAVCYRGTDKWIEVSPISIGHYWHQVRQLLNRDPKLRLLIQTDSKAVRDEGMHDFGQRACYFEELPVTTGATVMHQVDRASRGLSNFELGVNLLAAVLIMSECRFLVMHTGNVGLWTYLFRGNAAGTCQLMPAAPRVISRLPGHSRLRALVARGLRPLLSA